MTLHTASDDRLLRLAAGLDQLVAAEVRKVRGAETARLAAELADAEILRACRRVGAASDAVQQARYAGNAVERKMLARLERAAKDLADVMRKQGGAA